MNPLRLPRERVGALDPAPIEKHLLAQGWRERPGASSERFGVFCHPSYPDEEILLPRDKDFVDYALRIGEVLMTLGDVERRPAWEILDLFSDAGGKTPQDGDTQSSGSKVRRGVS